MIIAALLVLLMLIGVFEFLIFRQRNKYQKNLARIEDLNLNLGILRSLSYILQSKQTLQDDWNQLAKILSAQRSYTLPPLEYFLTLKTNGVDIFDKNSDPQKNFSISVDNIVKLILKKHELNKKLTPQQQREAVSVKW